MTTTTTWTKARFTTRVRDVLAEQLGVDIEEVTLGSTVVGDLGADSLDFVEIIMAFEEEFALEISDTDAEKLSTVRDVTDYLARRMKVADK